MSGRLEEILLRIAEGIEKLAEPEVEIEGGPPICPTCGTFNPRVLTMDESGGLGLLGELSIVATCQNCGHELIAIPESYSMHATRATASEEIRMKMETYSGIEFRQNSGE